MSSHNFITYDENIQDILDQICQRLELGISTKNSEEERKRICLRLESLIDEARVYLRKMELEVRLAPPQSHQTMISQIHKYTNEITRLNKKINEEKYAKIMEAARDSNFVAREPQDLDAQLRRQVLISGASLERTSESLSRSHAIAVETEQVGTEVLGELNVQRESLIRTRDHLQGTQEELSHSRKILQAMARSVLYNKVLLIIIIILEAFILGGLVYWKFFT